MRVGPPEGARDTPERPPPPAPPPSPFQFFLTRVIGGVALSRTPVHWPAMSGRERIHMNIPPNTKPWIQGAVVGAVAAAIVGFSWGGWVTGSSANKQASVAAHDATVM